MKPEEIFEVLKAKFNDSIVELNTSKIEPFIEVKPEEIAEVCYYLRDEETLNFDNLMLLSGVDDANGSKEKDEDGDTLIKGGTISVYYHIESTKHMHKLVLRVAMQREAPETESVENVWRSADWHEREAYDMFGIKFKNHPNLIRILMPYDWPDIYPLRKDYKSPEFYAGLKIPY